MRLLEPCPASTSPQPQPRCENLGAEATPPPALASPVEARPAELGPVEANQWSLRVTLDDEAKGDLERLAELLGHKNPRRDLAVVLKEALRCAVEVHGRRRGSLPAGRRVATAPAAAQPAVQTVAAKPPSRSIPAAVRREVWQRDGGRCSYVAPDGTRCGSRWLLELDHIRPHALGGASTADNLRIRCRVHNLMHAEAIFGVEHMAVFRAGGGRAG